MQSPRFDRILAVVGTSDIDVRVIFWGVRNLEGIPWRWVDEVECEVDTKVEFAF